jgi:NSS family neurotransmitter:Na+ symporter
MSSENLNTEKRGYSSQIALVLSLIAGAVGTGNIWRFPRVAAANGGGAFIVAWAIMTMFVCLSIMVGEHVMGRATRHGAPGAFRDFVGRKFTWMGTVIVIIMALVAAYYSAVIAWVAYYLGLSVTKGYHGMDKVALFDSVSNGNIVTVILFIGVLSVSAWIAYTGVKGIEKANKIFLPILLICVVIAAIRSVTLPGAATGMHYLFSFEFSELLNYKVWLEGLTQAVWSAGPGWGLVITLAVFSNPKSDVNMSTMTQVFGNASVSLIAALAVIPAIFALSPSVAAAIEVTKSGNNGLTFISMTQLFEQMPGGYFISIIFFTSLLFAALSSNICHFLIVSLPFADSGVKKKKAVTRAFLIMLILGLPSAWNVNFLSNQDWVAGQMMLVGALFSCFAISKFGAKKVRTKFLNNPYSMINFGSWWEVAIKVVAPATVLIMFLWWSIQSISWDPQWWNPVAVFSLGTFVVQGALIIIVAIVFNDKVADSIKEKHFDGEEFPEIPDNQYS